ncbi:apoptosis regulatory protein Siva-like [Pecten maximus]|uniref:apoptosis regulatory protein Siva-like n=1 Tax=Pecten maximus TaxID=6579 RepID=UPI0014584638|nr:apoptosis regulatory protein Siva-like [Pecten maximus]
MPKRRNPFGDCSPLQLKTHVGQKELSDGVSGKDHLKAVYEKTRQILFSGAMKSKTNNMITDANDNNIIFPSQSPPQTVPSTTLPGQMCLTHGGQLTMSAPSTQEQMTVDTCMSQRVPSATLPGQMCLDQTGQLTTPQEQMSIDTDPCPPKSFDFFKLKGKGNFPAKKNCQVNPSKCCFCENMVAKDSIQQCCSCQGDFCQLCSTINYDECMERMFCLNCNP